MRGKVNQLVTNCHRLNYTLMSSFIDLFNPFSDGYINMVVLVD